MRIRAWSSVAFVLVLASGAGACRKFITLPTTREPVISSAVAFPTTLGPGDSTMITVVASDPAGAPLVYDWEASNGLTIKGTKGGWLYNTASPTMVFYAPTTWPYPTDTAFVWCGVRDSRGGEAQRQVLIYYSN